MTGRCTPWVGRNQRTLLKANESTSDQFVTFAMHNPHCCVATSRATPKVDRAYIQYNIADQSGLQNSNQGVIAMTATTFTHIGGGASKGSSIGGWLKRVFWRISEVQEMRARDRVAAHFRGFDDAYLTKLGYNAADIRRVRNY